MGIWEYTCMAEGICINGGVRAWRGGHEECKRAVRILLECILVLVLGTYFMVRLAQHISFGDGEIIKFNMIISNMGGGYIDDVDNADYGKFIAPRNGTYQFNANLYNGNKLIAADLRKNGEGIIAANNGGRGAASLSAILDLKEEDEVYLEKPHWVADDAMYNRHFTSFSGVLIG